jgi:hypothetical protein
MTKDMLSEPNVRNRKRECWKNGGKDERKKDEERKRGEEGVERDMHGEEKEKTLMACRSP